MLEWEASDPEIGSAIRCPQCKSPRIEYPQMTRKFMTPWLASILFALKISQRSFTARIATLPGERWRPAAPTRCLGDFFLDGILRCRGASPASPRPWQTRARRHDSYLIRDHEMAFRSLCSPSSFLVAPRFSATIFR
jgi:hypothetical protein